MRISNNLLVDFSRALIILNLVALTGFILTISNFHIFIVRLSLYIIAWPTLVNLETIPWYIMIIVYYSALLFIPIFGFIKYKEKYRNVFSWLLFLNFINLGLFVGITGNFLLWPTV